MLNKLSVTIKPLLQSQTRLKILTFPTHEGYQSLLDHTGHDFYLVSGNGMKRWDFQTRPLPDNHYFFNTPLENLMFDIDFDLVLCQNRVAQFPIAHQIAERYNLPIVLLDHTEPPPGINKYNFGLLQNYSRAAKVNVFISEHNRATWQSPDGIVINHGIDTDLFSGYTGDILEGVSVVNQFPQRDVFCGWTLWSQLTKHIPVRLFGDNGNMSESINNPVRLSQEIGRRRFFLNTSQLSPVPMSLLEAMAVGCPVVSTAKQQIPHIIQNGVNGFISNDPNELLAFANLLLSDKDLATKIGAAGRQTIVERFSLAQFVEQWNTVFNKAIS